MIFYYMIDMGILHFFFTLTYIIIHKYSSKKIHISYHCSYNKINNDKLYVNTRKLFVSNISIQKSQNNSIKVCLSKALYNLPNCF